MIFSSSEDTRRSPSVEFMVTLAERILSQVSILHTPDLLQILLCSPGNDQLHLTSISTTARLPIPQQSRRNITTEQQKQHQLRTHTKITAAPS